MRSAEPETTSARQGSLAPAVRHLSSWPDASILVVDDYAANVMLLKRLLEESGLRDIDGYTDPRLALRRFEQRRPDLVLLDLHMAHIDGYALMEAMLAQIPVDEFLPIIIVTGDARPGACQRALSAGAKDFITKPFDVSEVTLRVANLLQIRALHDGLHQHNAFLATELRSRFASDQQRRLYTERRQRIDKVLHERSINTVFQSIVNIRSGEVVGVEALSRFTDPLVRTPNLWFEEAHQVGLGPDLELLAIETALSQVDALPGVGFVAVNLSPRTVIDPAVISYLEQTDLSRLVIEITEHDRADCYEVLCRTLDTLRGAGARIAVDDAGAGFAGLQQILELAPDIIKLDIAVTRGIDTDRARRSLTKCLLAFADEIGASIIAEGVETVQELDALRGLGVTLAQGFLLAKPAPAPAPADRVSETTGS